MEFSQLKDYIALLIMVGTPIVSVTGAFYTGKQSLADYKLQVEQQYVHKEDMKAISEKLDKVANDVSEIKGMLKSGKSAVYPSKPLDRSVSSASFSK